MGFPVCDERLNSLTEKAWPLDPISKNTKSRNSCEHNLPLDIAAPVSPRWTQHIIFSSLCSVFYSYLAACGNGKSSVRPLPLTYIVVSKTLK
uniref:Uncharacterized protein n=1 Tax=Populus trichocarpa TaxID=3694 RepID=U5GC16_POPTR